MFYYFIFICALGPNSPTLSLPSVKIFMTLSLNPRVALCISKIEQVMAIFVRQQKENLVNSKFLNLYISDNLLDFSLNFCMRPLYVPSNKRSNTHFWAACCLNIWLGASVCQCVSQKQAQNLCIGA